jgi:hypothetical protein
MLAITLGFAAPGRSAPPVPLYVGNDASAAEAVFLAPPDGIIRTEMIKAPVITRRRYFEQPEIVAAAPVETPAPTPKPAKAKA